MAVFICASVSVSVCCYLHSVIHYIEVVIISRNSDNGFCCERADRFNRVLINLLSLVYNPMCSREKEALTSAALFFKRTMVLFLKVL